VRTDKADPASNEEAMAHWKLTLKDPDERKVGRAVSDALTELALSSIPGFTGSGQAGGSRPYGVFTPALVDASLVPQHVVILNGDRTVVDSVAPSGSASIEPIGGPAASDLGGPTTKVPLGTVFGARSGDKGGNANLGVFARTDAAWTWLDAHLTTDALRGLLPEAADMQIDRHRLPGIRSLNFLIHGLLQEGVAASTRLDGQAKSLGEWLRARHVDLPNVLLP